MQVVTALSIIWFEIFLHNWQFTKVSANFAQWKNLSRFWHSTFWYFQTEKLFAWSEKLASLCFISSSSLSSSSWSSFSILSRTSKRCLFENVRLLSHQASVEKRNRKSVKDESGNVKTFDNGEVMAKWWKSRLCFWNDFDCKNFIGGAYVESCLLRIWLLKSLDIKSFRILKYIFVFIVESGIL